MKFKIKKATVRQKSVEKIPSVFFPVLKSQQLEREYCRLKHRMDYPRNSTEMIRSDIYYNRGIRIAKILKKRGIGIGKLKSHCPKTPKDYKWKGMVG